MSLETGMALFFSAGAVCTDLFLEKVPNRWIVLGLAAGAVCQGLLHGAVAPFAHLKMPPGTAGWRRVP